ncbi:MAG: phosphoribosylanthranilate isomerase [Saprospiraceae bacterium]|nr:phosphoribosylanthranilate isomerase [Saprospiraceae bacterium]
MHGDESPQFARSLKSFIKVIKVFRIDDAFDPETLDKYNFCDYYLFDTATIHFGGSGHKFDWTRLHAYNIRKPFLLGGGIGPKDIEDVLKLSHPKFAGVDINSKFEISPGIKDVKMVREFVDALRKEI